jgi:multiple antibiotic resistance protein
MNTFLLVFVPLFVAIDSIGILPLFWGLTGDLKKPEKHTLAMHAIITAFITGFCFVLGGRYVFLLLGITPSDFRIAGGLLLLIFSIREIMGHTTKQLKGISNDPFRGIVPLGIPLTAGPAMITTLLILQDEYSLLMIMAALALNLLITYFLFLFSDEILKRLGAGPSKAITKIAAIFLGAIGIMMIRRGLEGFFKVLN